MNEVFIGWRTDGIAGTGTQSDPLDGSTNLSAPLPVTTLINIGQEATAVVNKHGYTNGDVVVIAGVTGDGAKRWNGSFIIYSVASYSFKYRMTGVPVAKSAGTISASKVMAFRFDEIMRNLPEKTRIHLGPTPNGPFLTRGSSPMGWSARAGMKISGAGMDVTTLQLIGDIAVGHFTGVTGTVDFFELSDLTIDCNSTLPAATPAACGAIRVMGNHVRIFRVKVINWGTNSSTIPCFAISVVTADGTVAVSDCGIHDCIVEQPATSPMNSRITALHAGAFNADAFGKVPFIRNCYVDCGWPGTLMDSRGISMNGCIGGTVEGNQIHNTKYGGPCAENARTHDLVVRNNFYKNVAKGPYWTGILNHLLVEGNTIELAPGTKGLIGIHVDDNPAFTYTHGDVIVRNNKIRYLDGSFAPSNTGYGIHVNGAKHLLVLNNILEVAPKNPLRNQRCGASSYFNNRAPNGTLIRGVEFTTGRKYDELETEAEDAFILGMLKPQ